MYNYPLKQVMQGKENELNLTCIDENTRSKGLIHRRYIIDALNI